MNQPSRRLAAPSGNTVFAATAAGLLATVLYFEFDQQWHDWIHAGDAWGLHALPIALAVGCALLGLVACRRQRRQHIAAIAREDEIRDAIDNISEGFVFYDAEERLISWNRAYCDLYPEIADCLTPGMRLEDVLRLAAERGQNLDATGNEKRWLRRRLSAYRTGRGTEELAIRGDRWIRASQRRTGSGGIVGIRTDITQQKQAEAELTRIAERLQRQYGELQSTKTRFKQQSNEHAKRGRELATVRDAANQSEHHYRTLAETSPLGIWQTGCDGQFLYANPSLCALLGVGGTADVQSRPYQSFFTPESLGKLEQAFESWKRGETVTCQATIAGPRGATRREVEMCGARVVSPGGETLSILTTVADITERKQSENTIRRMANHDLLTGLVNRKSFFDRLDEAIANAKRHERSVAVMCLDIDKFKEINDSFGHPVGDELLRNVASRLKNITRPTDTVARLGGDEFAIILSNIEDMDPVHAMATRIIEAIAKPLTINDCIVAASTSIGVSFYPHDDAEPLELMRKSEQALTQAKSDGRGRYHVFDADLHDKIRHRARLQSELRKAVEREEFVLHYQPQIGIAGGEIVGVEALVRWNHPERGLVPPNEWIPLAEASGLIVPIGEWVLRTACAQNKAWQDAGLPAFRVAVNISAAQFHGGNLVPTVQSALQDSGLTPRWLELELTESMVIENVDRVIEELHRLRALGVEMAIDDFGTGYSSLAYLKRFPVDRLKIDRSFVMNITTDPNDAAIAEAVISLAHNLDLMVIAEGVETKDQLAFLTSRGCDEAQGYYFGRPQAADDLAEWVGMRPRMPWTLAASA